MKKIAIFIFILSSSFFLTSCDWVISAIGNLMCKYAPDTDHCFQFTAVQWGNPNACNKIKWTKFKDVWSNPPRDKCFLQIAVNKWDYSICNKIVGWAMSYTVEWCILDTAIKKEDPKWCSKLASFPSEYASCKWSLVSLDKVNQKDSQINDLIEKIKNDPDNSDLKKQLSDAKNKQNDIYNELSDWEKTEYFKSKREQILSDVEDEDVKSAIANSYTKLRWNNPDMKIWDLVDSLKKIKEEQEQIKRIDDYANELTDTIKWQLDEIVNDKIDEAKDEIMWKVWGKALDYINKNWWENMKWALKNLEWMRDKYEKWSEKYNELQSKYTKLKWYYDEVMWVYKKVDDINNMVAQGKITEGQAQAIKWWVFLQKWLEYSTKYVPVFGSTISKISKETFEVVINKAKERWERTNSLQKCIDDPANCDPSWISAY